MTGPLLFLAGIALFAALDANSKLLSGTFGVAQAVLLRHVAILALLGTARTVRPGAGGSLRTVKPWAHIARALCMVVSAAAFFLGFRTLPLAEGYLVFFSSPLFTLALAALLLREHVPRAAWFWCAVGFLGVLLAIAPKLGQGGALGGYLWVAFGTLGYALTQTINRLLREEAGIARILLWPSAIGLVAYAPFALIEWVPPTGEQWLRLLANGVFAGGASLLTALAFRHADAARLGPYGYVALPVAALIDILVWGAWPDAWMLAGGIVVVVACVLSERARRQGQAHGMSGGKTWVPSGPSGNATTARTAASGRAP